MKLGLKGLKGHGVEYFRRLRLFLCDPLLVTTEYDLCPFPFANLLSLPFTY